MADKISNKISVDLVQTHPNRGKRVFYTATIGGKPYEDFIDCPLNMTVTPEEYLASSLVKITADIAKEQDGKESEEGKKDYKHYHKVKELKELEKAKTIEEKVDMIIEMLKNQM